MKHVTIEDGIPLPGRTARKAPIKDHAFDVGIGGKIRALRTSNKMSQTQLGIEVGVSFQQIQKYEKGSDRISASMLKAVAGVLGVHPGEFFDEAPSEGLIPPLMGMPELRAQMQAGELLGRIKDPKVRRKAIALIETLAHEDQAAATKAAAAE